MKKICPRSYCLLIFFPLIFPQISFPQNVGIGVNPTRARFEVHGALGNTSAIFGGDNMGVSIQRNSPAIGFNHYFNGTDRYISNGFAAVQMLDQSSGLMLFNMFSSGTKDAGVSSMQLGMAIGTNGNIGIRTAPANATLYAPKLTNANGAAVFGGSTYNSHFMYDVAEDTYIRGGLDGSFVYINDIPAGRVLLGNGSTHVSINNGTPTYPLEIREINLTGIRLTEPDNNFNTWEQRVRNDVQFPGATYANLYYLYNGVYKCYISGALYVFSDSRLKKNIADIPSVLEKYMKLKPVQYDMKYSDAPQKHTMGFIAQDVEKLFPELVAVTGNMNHGYPGIDKLYGLNYDGFRMLTIKAIQEQQEKIKIMELNNAELEKRIAAAEALLR